MQEKHKIVNRKICSTCKETRNEMQVMREFLQNGCSNFLIYNNNNYAREHGIVQLKPWWSTIITSNQLVTAIYTMDYQHIMIKTVK